MKTKLNETQFKAIKHEKGPLLVVAGAGTGKTRVITERIKYLIEHKSVKPSEILALTFTDKAAGEMVERTGDVMPLGYEEPWIYTFHSFADRVLRAEGIEIGLDPSYKLLSSSEQWILLRKNIFKMGISYFRPLGNPTKFISDVLKFISRFQDEDISAQDLEDFVSTNLKNYDEIEQTRWKELALIYKEYTRLKLERSRLDFGDLITWTIRLFKERPNILKKYQRQFKHILVDEFQDTNYSQYVMIKLLFPQGVQKNSERSLIVVGDDSQSIYKFRGAAISNILEFKKDYPQAEMLTLLENYRSSQAILDAAYKLIQNNNPDTLEATLGISKELVGQISKVIIKPQIIQLDTLENEAEFVTDKIYEVLAKEPQYTYKDIAILARANNHLEPFLLNLRQHGVPYQLVGNRGLYDREEIRDVIALLKIIVDPGDAISLYRVLNISTLEIPYSEITRLLALSKNKRVGLWETVKESENEFVLNFVKVLEKFQQNITKVTTVEYVHSLVHSVKYLDQFTEDETIENQLAIKNLDIFLNIVKKFEINFHQDFKEYPTVVDLLEFLELMLEASDNPAQAEIEDIDTVNLMTVHASKGTEYPVVFVVNMVSDRFPTRNKSDAIEIPNELIKETLPIGDAHIQEERRLFYVALTRAKKYLFATLGKDYGGKREKMPSGFLNEIGLKIEPTEIEQEKGPQQTLFGATSGFRETKATKITNFIPNFLSYSQIDSYLNCPLQYKYKYVLRIPTLPSHALSFGTTIHDTLRDFHTKLMFEKTVTLKELLQMYEKNWQPLGYLNEEHRKIRYESGKKLLENYYKKTKNDTPGYIALEKSFNIKIDGIRFYGRIDRIDTIDNAKNNEVEIIDYKTGNAKTQKDVDKDMQVAIYAIGAKEGLGYEPKKLSLYFLEEGIKLTTTRSEKDLEETKAQLRQVVNEIKAGKFVHTPGMHCNWCDFKAICPFVYKG